MCATIGKFSMAIFLYFSAISMAVACDQNALDAIYHTSKKLSDLKEKYQICTGIGLNRARSECWKANPFVEGDEEVFLGLMSKYKGYLAKCNMDSIRYNLGNLSQSFGEECKAFEYFSQIRSPGSLRSARLLPPIMASAALECARSSPDDHEKLKSAFIYMKTSIGKISRNSLENRRNYGKTLGAWRDLFSVPLGSADSTSIAKNIVSQSDAWVEWTDYLPKVRVHFSNKDDFYRKKSVSEIAAQYDLLGSLL
jgi:hypothetical protein